VYVCHERLVNFGKLQHEKSGNPVQHEQQFLTTNYFCGQKKTVTS
jgi:hypothetical protein